MSAFVKDLAWRALVFSRKEPAAFLACVIGSLGIGIGAFGTIATYDKEPYSYARKMELPHSSDLTPGSPTYRSPTKS